MQLPQNCLHVSRPHVLGGVDSEPCHAQVNEVVQVLGDLGAHVVLLQRKIKETNQATVSDLLGQKFGGGCMHIAFP